ncbi:MAG: zinc ribbon domain-containing protein [Pseudohongiella sp.]|uniref:FmdB family zinc ribbon protein n=1 Tax=Pseudohongiella sp. TaxID=1979412 RepID=UPI00349FD721
MPIYEYQCKECGHRLEAIQKFSDAPLTECPACHHLDGLSKQVSAPSFRLKGGGWYETDFKTGNKRHGTQDSSAGDSPAAGATKSGTGNAPASGTAA